MSRTDLSAFCAAVLSEVVKHVDVYGGSADEVCFVPCLA